MSDSTVTLERRGATAVLKLDDGKANALSPAVIDAVHAALDRAADAKALVITGRPGKFCAGFDLRVMLSGPDAARDLVGRGARLLARIYLYPRPVVLACTGHALAGGALLLTTGDTRIGASGPFKIGLNEIQAGIPLPAFGVALVRDRLAPAALTRATLHARIHSPEEAAAVGFLDRVTSPEAVLDEALAEAERLGSFSARPFAQTKERLRGPTVASFLADLDADLLALLPPRPAPPG